MESIARPKKPNNVRILTNNELKMVAIVTMLIDHTAVVLIENTMLKDPFRSVCLSNWGPEWLSMWEDLDRIMRLVGRLSFPIFCYLLVEGFLHTRDVRKYILRLLLFAVLSEIPFDLAAFDTWFYPQYQNVFVTLFWGLLALAGIRRFETEGEKGVWKQALVFLVCCGGVWLMKGDYDVFGVFFIVLLYLCRSQVQTQTILGSIALMWEITAPLAFIPIRMYQGARGNKRWKWFFYGFYPVHLLVLVCIRKVVLAFFIV